ncbi:unnamed protein product [Polarella glacialis]|uniref:Transmembrane protein n=1 Tax=Polarella glacialis TaxID=89957 RepID=A0A813JA48_POLGL|nr:unnamed protein product [Polarella glacialis]
MAHLVQESQLGNGAASRASTWGMPMLQPSSARDPEMQQVSLEENDETESEEDSSTDEDSNRLEYTVSELFHQENLQKAIATKKSFNSPELWMLIFGNVLAVMAGLVDAVSLFVFQLTTTNMTGATADLGISIHDLNYEGGIDKVRKMALLVMFFTVGAFLCGLIIPGGKIHFGGKSFYGTALIAESILLIITSQIPEHEVAPYFAAMSAGLQNAMCSMHFGAVVRTTHVTGTLTDIGSTSGRAVMILLRRVWRRRKLGVLETAELEVDARKLKVLVPLFTSFFFGCFLGACLHKRMSYNAFLVPAAVTGTAGVVYTFMREALKKAFQSYEVDRLNEDVGEMNSMLDRSRRALQLLIRRRPKSGEDAPDVESLDQQIRNMVERMHEVENVIEEMCQSEPVQSPAQHPAARHHTAHF